MKLSAWWAFAGAPPPHWELLLPAAVLFCLNDRENHKTSIFQQSGYRFASRKYDKTKE